MCNWNKWVWPGIFATIFLTALAMLMQSKNIENDLTAKATDTLSAQHSWATVELDGRDLTLTGMAFSEEAQQVALKLADDAYDVRIAKDGSTLIPLANPFKLSALKDGNTVTLTGSVPNEAVRAEMIVAAKAAAPDAEVIDKTVLARGAPAGFAALSAFGIGQLKGLVSGEAKTDNLNLSVTGLANDFTSYDGAVMTLAGAIPSGGKVVMAKIDPPLVDLYKFSAIKNENSVVLNGFYPDEKTHMELVKAATDISPTGKIVDNLKIAGGAPIGFAALSTFGIVQLKNLVSGESSIEKLKLSIVGKAKDTAVRESAMSMLSGAIPAGGEVVLAQIEAPKKIMVPKKIEMPKKVEVLPIVPYNFTAIKNENNVILNGYYPDEATRTRLVQAAKMVSPTGNVIDNLKLGAGDPVGFEAVSVYGIGQLSGLVSGSASVTDLGLTVIGRATSSETYKGTIGALSGSIPAGGNVSLVNITPPLVSPYSVSVLKSKTSVVLNGYYPNEAIHARLVKAAKNAMPSGKVIDNLQPAVGAPSGFGDLGVKTISQLNRFSVGFVQVKDKAITIRGTALSPNKYDAAKTAAAGSFPAQGNVIDVKIKRNTASPFVFTATKKDGSLILEGHVSSAADEKVIVAYSASQNENGSNRASLDIVNGVPSDINWPEAIEIAVLGTSQLSNGSAKITDNAYTIKGKALTDASYEIAVKTGKTILSKGIKSVSVDISRPPISPYKWQYSRTGESRTAALSGHVPNFKLSKANEKQIADALGTDAKIYNVLKVGSGQPRGFAAATSVAINTASRLVDGRATIVDTNVFVKGEALTENAAADTRRQIENSLPPGFTGKHLITVRAPVIAPKPLKCSVVVSKVFVSNSIKFEIASDKINDVSRGLLDRLAAASKACRFSELTIEGHTDADGGEDYNQGLSEARAKTVRSYLAFNGYLLGNLKTVGFGEANPIASNDTQLGKAQNRRINIIVTKN